jgi:hypothetical protein
MKNRSMGTSIAIGIAIGVALSQKVGSTRQGKGSGGAQDEEDGPRQSGTPQ